MSIQALRDYATQFITTSAVQDAVGILEMIEDLGGKLPEDAHDAIRIALVQGFRSDNAHTIYSADALALVNWYDKAKSECMERVYVAYVQMTDSLEDIHIAAATENELEEAIMEFLRKNKVAHSELSYREYDKITDDEPVLIWRPASSVKVRKPKMGSLTPRDTARKMLEHKLALRALYAEFGGDDPLELDDLIDDVACGVDGEITDAHVDAVMGH